MASSSNQSTDKIHEDLEASTSLEHNDAKLEEPPITETKFLVDRGAISVVAEKDLAPELHNLDLSVYDQDVFEAAVLKQVDNALEQQEAGKAAAKKASNTEFQGSDLEEGEISDDGFVHPGNQIFQSQDAESETEIEKQIRLGEITPFGTSINGPSASASKKEESILEKYLRDQEKLKASKNVKKRSKDPLQKSVLNRDGKKKKPRKKEKLGTKKKAYCPYKEPDPMVSETNTIDFDEDSGSEYVPSDLEASSDEEARKYAALKASEAKRPKKNTKRRKRTYSSDFSIHTDDSFSDSSDEKKRKKRKYSKEIDDGDETAYEKRLRRVKKDPNFADFEENLHKFDDFAIPEAIWNKLYNYQKVGVRWLWELDRKKCGGLLGDEMGLGKTIQIIAFLSGIHHAQLRNKYTCKRGLGPSLIVCPTTVMHQWVREFHTWAPQFRVAILHESGSFCGKKANLICDINSTRGIIVTSYSGIVQHKDEILPRKWHYVILDEGHKIRNPDAQVTLTVKQLRTPNRIILSGSPMQNNLKELWSLFDFILPGKLGTLPIFLAEFSVPITQGGYSNASQVQVATAFKCATILKETISPYLLRRMKCDVKSHIQLPEKNEQVLFCRLTDIQRELYQNYVNSREVSEIVQGHLKIFMGLINLRKICNHPDLFSGGPKLLVGEKEEDFPEEERYGHWSKSGKMIVVDTLLKIWHKQGHRVLLFTQSRQMLCIMESYVIKNGYNYLKMDGGTTISARQPLITKFNQDKSFFVLLLTTRVGGLGVNLTGANRVLIYDPDWNPATDTQARERAWRIGQQQKVTVYRLITAGTVEEKMYHRQIFKQFLCNKVLKDPRQRRFFKSNDLFELFTLKETSSNKEATETSAIFAGTGSEVSYNKLKSDYRKAKDRVTQKSQTPVKPSVTFSQSKIEKMKQLAQELSKKFNKNDNERTNDSESVSVAKSDECDVNVSSSRLTDSNSKFKDNLSSDCDKPVLNSLSQCNISEVNEPSSSLSSKNVSKNEDSSLQSYKHKKKHKKHKHKRRNAKFEGEEVPHLVGLGDFNDAKDEEEEKDGVLKEDDYVLKKLFSRSGLQTVMQHDTIMEGGPADYALVEGEAERVAKKAVEALKESRAQCWQPNSGIPTWTGQSGLIKTSVIKNIKKIGTTSGAISSAELLEKIRQRNGDVKTTSKELELLTDIRDFISTQGGTTTTDELIKKFQKRLPPDVTPLFKSLLTQICRFHRGLDKTGYWHLKEDFM